MKAKNLQKKAVSLIMAFVMSASLAGCGSKDSSKPETETKTSEKSTEEKPVNKNSSENMTEEIYSEAETITEAITETITESIAETESETPEIATEKENEDGEDEYVVISADEDSESLSSTQRNSINMLNYMTVLTQTINDEKGSQLLLEKQYHSLVNDIYPNAVDTKTQAQISSLLDTIDAYRMISVKRDRLEFIYEQNRAQALRQAIPNPIGLLSAVQSGSALRAAVSVIYMAVDSAASYQAATSQAELQFIKDGWELDDEENKALHNSTKDALNYMFDMVRDYSFPGDYALNEESVQAFVSWSSKPDSQIVNKIAWLESHEDTYLKFGPYWLELAKDYYNSEEYEKCLESIRRYEEISTRIFRKDIDYATALPMAILSAKEIMDPEEYVALADQYCSVILDNTKDADWCLRYSVAQIYLDLFSLTEDDGYLSKAYKVAFDNVVVLVDEQKSLNTTYLADIKKEQAGKDATKREKKDIKRYNKLLEDERKVALPPVSEALYLNCDLLFALADKINIPDKEKDRIDAILHENGENIFLTDALDDRFWFEKKDRVINAEELDVSFSGDEFSIPAACLTERSIVSATVSGEEGEFELDDWMVTNVKRPKNALCSEFIVTFASKKGKDYKYSAGDKIIIEITPVEETPEEQISIAFDVEASKKAIVFDGIEFKRGTV